MRKKLVSLFLGVLLLAGFAFSEWRFNPFTNKLDYYEPAITPPANLTDLSDTPSSYTGKANQLLRVKADETGIEFFAGSPAGTVIVADGTGGWTKDADFLLTGKKLFINESSVWWMDAGIVVNQDAFDSNIMQFKSSDVNHGITDWAETDTYFYASKSLAAGGVHFAGFGTYYGLTSRAFITSETTSKTGGTAPFTFNVAKKAGTGKGPVSSAANLLTINNDGTQCFLFDAAGILYASDSYAIGTTKMLHSTGGADNVWLGSGTGASITTGHSSIGIGTNALGSATTGFAAVAIGYNALANQFTTSYGPIAIGWEAGKNLSGEMNIVIGYRAASANWVQGSYNIIMGYDAGRYLTNASYNQLIGLSAGQDMTSARYSTAIGDYALENVTSPYYNIGIGYRAGRGLTTGAKNIMIGSEIMYPTSTAYENVIIGDRAAYSLNSGYRNVILGQEAAYYITSGRFNLIAGFKAGYDITDGMENALVGPGAAENITSADYSTVVGPWAAFSLTTGAGNTVVGREAMGYNKTGNYNTILGYQAGKSEANQNISYNVFIGYQAGFDVLNGANYNVYIGERAGYNCSYGTGNVFIGRTAGYNETGSNKLYIDNISTANPLIYGEFDNDFLKCNGDFQVTDGMTIPVSIADTSNPPTDAELDIAFGTPATVGTGWYRYLNDAGLGNNFYLIVSDGTNWWIFTGTKAT